MAFDRKLLNQDEELVLDLRPHWWFLVPPGAALAAAVIVSLLVLVWWGPEGTGGSILKVLLGALVLVCLGWFVQRYLKWTTTNYVLTSDRFITRRGVVAKEGVEIPLERINTVFFRQSLFERMVGSGDLAIESAGERGSDTFSNIRRPSVVQKEIYVQMEANENRKFDRIHRGGPPVDATTPQGGGSIPEQIEKLSELHQRGVLSDAEFQRKKAELLDRM